TRIEAEHPEFVKWEAITKANTLAAILCNHTRQAPKNWSERKIKYKTREKQLIESLASIRTELKKNAEAIRSLKKESAEKRKSAAGKEQRKKAQIQYDKKIKTLNDKQVNLARREEKATISLGKLRSQMSVAMENRSWNLTTSQKSYIDPRVFYNWGLKKDYDVLEKYYSTTLRNKFQWVKDPGLNPGLPLEILSDDDGSET
ncbi:MAG: hypothetical protein EHM72_09865, partial [Calditrichaeota bacterium]